ncbi:MAG: carbohydrate ABC transporter permease, partial [Clostridia bacterium]|nr:carbohydrate ABC transporter permease [Clostridia bacterium]
MILPIVGSLPSEISMLRSLNLYDKFFGIVIMKCNFLGMYFLIFYAMYKSMPWEFAESAFIDGAGHFSVFLAIYMPLVRTTFVSVYLLNFIAYWNDYMTNAMYLPSMPTLAFGIHSKQFSGGLFSKPTMQLTTSIILAVPLIALFAVFQKRLMGSLTIGGIKG